MATVVSDSYDLPSRATNDPSVSRTQSDVQKSLSLKPKGSGESRKHASGDGRDGKLS
jgi:hypothetical protein